MMNMQPTTSDQTASRPVHHAAREPGQATGPQSRRNRLMTWLAGKTRPAGDCLFRADDALATARGWQITSGRFGLSRVYRDPRFETRGQR